MKRLTFLCAAAILLLSLSLPALALNSLTNGSFESPTMGNPINVGSATARNINFRTYTGANATAWAWGWWGNDGGYVRNGTANASTPLSVNQKDGLHWVSVDGGSAGAKYGGIMQAVDVMKGYFFYFNGWFRAKTVTAGSTGKAQIWLFATAPTFVGGVTTGELITSGGGVVAQAAVDESLVANTTVGWNNYTNRGGLCATGDQIWVVTRFYTTDATSGADMHMDGFSLTGVVPEPGTLVGLIGLSGMLGFAIRRRR